MYDILVCFGSVQTSKTNKKFSDVNVSNESEWSGKNKKRSNLKVSDKRKSNLEVIDVKEIESKR